MANQRKNTSSVIICTHNRYDYLKEAVGSLLSQETLPDEICIVDDGSSIDIQKLWLDEFPDHENSKKPKFLFTKVDDLGPSGARNAGVKKTSGDILFFLDDDDLYEDRYISTVLNEFEKSNFDICVSWLRCFDGNNTWPGKHFPLNHFEHNPYIRNIGFVGSNIVVKRTIFNSISGFDESLLGSEDKDFYIRLRQVGVKFSIIQEELIRYRVHASDQASGLYRFHPFQVSGKQKFLVKHDENMDRETYKTLYIDVAFFQMMGGVNLLTKLDGFRKLALAKPSKLLLALYIVWKKIK